MAGARAAIREEGGHVINSTIGVGVAGVVLTTRTFHAAHTAAPAAAVKHRAAAAIEASVDRGHT